MPNRILNKAIALEGEVSMKAKGVTLFIDVAAEEAYIETSADFDPSTHMEVLLDAQTLIECFGYQVITEEPPTEYDDGRVRHWAEQIYFPMERQLSVAG